MDQQHNQFHNAPPLVYLPQRPGVPPPCPFNFSDMAAALNTPAQYDAAIGQQIPNPSISESMVNYPYQQSTRPTRPYYTQKSGIYQLNPTKIHTNQSYNNRHQYSASGQWSNRPTYTPNRPGCPPGGIPQTATHMTVNQMSSGPYNTMTYVQSGLQSPGYASSVSNGSLYFAPTNVNTPASLNQLIYSNPNQPLANIEYTANGPRTRPLNNLGCNGTYINAQGYPTANGSPRYPASFQNNTGYARPRPSTKPVGGYVNPNNPDRNASFVSGPGYMTTPGYLNGDPRPYGYAGAIPKDPRYPIHNSSNNVDKNGINILNTAEYTPLGTQTNIGYNSINPQDYSVFVPIPQQNFPMYIPSAPQSFPVYVPSGPVSTSHVSSGLRQPSVHVPVHMNTHRPKNSSNTKSVDGVQLQLTDDPENAGLELTAVSHRLTRTTTEVAPPACPSPLYVQPPPFQPILAHTIPMGNGIVIASDMVSSTYCIPPPVGLGLPSIYPVYPQQ